ncbi:phosphatase PAP2 family protein [Roseivivax jejudonensis]|nr:phosphatase PAP2 family protein [Roseivivax jejudonensis]
MDEVVFNHLNSLNGGTASFDLALRNSQIAVFKSLPFALVLWALWFSASESEGRRTSRERLVAALLCMVPIIGLTRLIANFAPFSARPLHADGFELNLQDSQSRATLDGWSSMPSDHASLFFGFAVAVLTINRKAGMFLLLWSVLVVSMPRVIMGLHWPSDIVAGWCIGASIALVLMRPVSSLVRRAQVIPYFEKREAVGYPLLFFATFEFTQMFATGRRLIDLLFL